MAGSTKPAPVLRVVGVESLLYELTSVEGPVVGVDGGLAAWLAVPVLGLSADAGGVLGEDAGAEAALVFAAVAALPGGAAPAVGFGTVLFAASALAELGAAGLGAHTPACPFCHAGHPLGSTVLPYQGGWMRRDTVIAVTGVASIALVVGIARGRFDVAAICLVVLLAVFVATAPMGAGKSKANPRRPWWRRKGD